MSRAGFVLGRFDGAAATHDRRTTSLAEGLFEYTVDETTPDRVRRNAIYRDTTEEC